ncbi:MAG: hypothetical protein U0350_25745 [Caldilineaceae bacterium]
MIDNLSDQEMSDLFHRNMPWVEMPTDALEQIKQNMAGEIEKLKKASSSIDASRVSNGEMLPLPRLGSPAEEHGIGTLFSGHMPLVPMPPELAEQLKKRVLAEVAATLKAQPVANGAGMPAHAARSAAPTLRGFRRSVALPVQMVMRTLSSWLQWLQETFRMGPYMALAGAALVLFLVVLVSRISILKPSQETLRANTAQPSISTPGTAPLIAYRAKVIITGGTATIQKADGKIEKLNVGVVENALGPGDRLLTGNSTVRIEYFEGQTTTVDPGADVELQEYMAQGDTTRVALLVHTGKTSHEVDTALASNDLFEVRTPAAVANVKQSKLTIEALSATQTHIETQAGTAQIATGNQELVVAAGQQITAILGTVPFLATITPTVTSLVVAPFPLLIDTPSATAVATSKPTIPLWPTSTVAPLVPTNEVFPVTVTPFSALPTPTPTQATSILVPTETPSITVGTGLTNTNTPTVFNTPTVTNTATNTPSATATVTNTKPPPTYTPILVPTATDTPILVPTKILTSTDTPVPPTATATPILTPTATATHTPVTPTNTRVPTKTDTPVPPTSTYIPPTKTSTPVPPTKTDTPAPTDTITVTDTPLPPTHTQVAPTDTNTAVPPTHTPTPTVTPVPPTNTVIPPTDTSTAIPPTYTSAPPTDTNTAIPPTNTSAPPTATPVPPTDTPVPPTDTSTAAPPTHTPALPTDTPVPPTDTNTAIPPTHTPALPTATPVPPTATPVPPTATDTVAPPTDTPEPPTPTSTPDPPTPTDTLAPPTDTPAPPTSTNTPEPPTATPEPPTATPVPPTATDTVAPPTDTPEPPTPTATPEAPTATSTPDTPTVTPTDTPQSKEGH